mmetsp:Transcript_5199/g.19368  ORF Transcript_5199/g.19368 Transcript_5199/m.19368 type:complete len:476 (-) Transcript_5199:1242-2669(-)
MRPACLARARRLGQLDGKGRLALGQLLQKALDRGHIREAMQALGVLPQLGRRLRAAQHQLGQQGLRGAGHAQAAREVVLVAHHAATADGVDQVQRLQLLHRRQHLGLAHIHHRVARRLLIAAGGQGIGRQRVAVGHGALLLDQHGQHAGLQRGQASLIHVFAIVGRAPGRSQAGPPWRCCTGSMPVQSASPRGTGWTGPRSAEPGRTRGTSDTETIVGLDDGPVDEVALVGTQHQQRGVEVLGLAHPLARQQLHQLLALLGAPVVMVDLGVDIARADRVHIDAVLAPLQGHRTGHVDDGRLAHRVDADLPEHAKARHRCDVDDAPADEGARRRATRPGQHALAHLLRDEEGAARVGVHHEVVVVLGDVGEALGGADAGVVDQDVQRADLGLGMGHGGLDADDIGDVQRHDMGVAAAAFDLGAQVLEPLDTAAGQHDTGTGLGQGLGELRAQAAGRTGDQGHAAFEVDGVTHETAC